MTSALAFPIQGFEATPPFSAAFQLSVIEGGAPLRAAIAEQIPALYRRALKLARGVDAASDLLQDSIERALRFESQFEKGTNLLAWLYTLMYRVFVTKVRRLQVARRVETIAANDPCNLFRPEYGNYHQELSPKLRAALEHLPSAFFEVVVAVDIEGAAYRDAAEELGVPVGTIMSRLHRARRMLRESLDAHEAKSYNAQYEPASSIHQA